jgi:hypothetical protein
MQPSRNEAIEAERTGRLPATQAAADRDFDHRGRPNRCSRS